MTAHGPQILLVDDNATNLQVLYQTLEGHGYRLLAARSGKDAIAIAQRAVPDVILLDVMMPEMDGFETCARLKADARTRDARDHLSLGPDRAERQGAGPRARRRRFRQQAVPGGGSARTGQDAPDDPRSPQAASPAQRGAGARTDGGAGALREARDRTDGVLLGDSAVAVRLRQDIQEAAASDRTLLISGPPGSDHEAVARAVHHQSRRAARAIICVNCLSAAPGDSPSSERTGGSADILDKLPLAHGGTLYLEGVQYLPRNSQRILAERLRVLDEARAAGPCRA